MPRSSFDRPDKTIIRHKTSTLSHCLMADQNSHNKSKVMNYFDVKMRNTMTDYPLIG